MGVSEIVDYARNFSVMVKVQGPVSFFFFSYFSFWGRYKQISHTNMYFTSNRVNSLVCYPKVIGFFWDGLLLKKFSFFCLSKLVVNFFRVSGPKRP